MPVVYKAINNGPIIINLGKQTIDVCNFEWNPRYMRYMILLTSQFSTCK